MGLRPAHDALRRELKHDDGNARLYSIVHNREHDNISWMLGESARFAPQEDSPTSGPA
jgi:hypothetical protein